MMSQLILVFLYITFVQGELNSQIRVSEDVNLSHKSNYICISPKHCVVLDSKSLLSELKEKEESLGYLASKWYCVNGDGYGYSVYKPVLTDWNFTIAWFHEEEDDYGTIFDNFNLSIFIDCFQFLARGVALCMIMVYMIAYSVCFFAICYMCQILYEAYYTPRSVKYSNHGLFPPRARPQESKKEVCRQPPPNSAKADNSATPQCS